MKRCVEIDNHGLESWYSLDMDILQGHLMQCMNSYVSRLFNSWKKLSVDDDEIFFRLEQWENRSPRNKYTSGKPAVSSICKWWLVVWWLKVATKCLNSGSGYGSTTVVAVASHQRIPSHVHPRANPSVPTIGEVRTAAVDQGTCFLDQFYSSFTSHIVSNMVVPQSLSRMINVGSDLSLQEKVISKAFQSSLKLGCRKHNWSPAQLKVLGS